jgi:hypothetical protein
MVPYGRTPYHHPALNSQMGPQCANRINNVNTSSNPIGIIPTLSLRHYGFGNKGFVRVPCIRGYAAKQKQLIQQLNNLVPYGMYLDYQSSSVELLLPVHTSKVSEP